jgi:hypothetical protein
MAGLIERNDKDIVGGLSCYDWVIITGTLPGFGHSEGMTSYLSAQLFTASSPIRLHPSFVGA